jgi:hypothetical protein
MTYTDDFGAMYLVEAYRVGTEKFPTRAKAEAYARTKSLRAKAPEHHIITVYADCPSHPLDGVVTISRWSKGKSWRSQDHDGIEPGC